MSTRLKVLNGTRSGLAPRLCDTCHSSGARYAGASSSAMSIPTARSPRCGTYGNLRQIAWVLDIDSRRQRIGFVRANEWERQHENEELIPSHLY